MTLSIKAKVTKKKEKINEKEIYIHTSWINCICVYIYTYTLKVENSFKCLKNKYIKIKVKQTK